MEFAATGVERCGVRRHRSKALWIAPPLEYGAVGGAGTGVRRCSGRRHSCTALWRAPPDLQLEGMIAMESPA